MTTHDFKAVPVIVNFNNELEGSDVERIKANFRKNRSNYGLIGIFTTFEKEKSSWDEISLPVFTRMISIGKVCYEAIHQQINKLSKHDYMVSNYLSIFPEALTVLIYLLDNVSTANGNLSRLHYHR